MRLILDTNVWAYLADADEGDALADLEDRLGFRNVVPPSILLETLRTSNKEVRERIVQVMTARGNVRIHPSTEAREMADELVAELRRLRPEWVRTFPETSQIKRLNKYWTKKLWQEARANPADVAKRADQQPIDDEAGEWLDVQEQNRDAASSRALMIGRDAVICRTTAKGFGAQGRSLSNDSASRRSPVTKRSWPKRYAACWTSRAFPAVSLVAS